MKQIAVIYKHVSELTPYARNPKQHPARQISNIAASLQRYGWRNPILVNFRTGEIIAGHGRYEAARKLGMESIPCIDGSDMTADQVREYRYLDNKLNESPWDEAIVAADVPGLDFGPIQLDWGLPEASIHDDPIDLDEEPPVHNSSKELKTCHCPKCGFIFEV